MNRKERIAELEKTANKISQTAKVRQVDSLEFLHYREGFLDGERLAAIKSLEIIKELEAIVEIQLQKITSNRNNLATALGLLKGCLHIRNMEDFDKDSLIKNLEEIEQLLTKILNEDDR